MHYRPGGINIFLWWGTVNVEKSLIEGDNSSVTLMDLKHSMDVTALRAVSIRRVAKLNHVDPQAWLADVLGRIADQTITRLDELLPWNWQTRPRAALAA